MHDREGNPVRYKDTAETNAARRELQDYNRQVADTDLSIQGNDQPFIEIDTKPGRRKKQKETEDGKPAKPPRPRRTKSKIWIGGETPFVRRVYYRNSLDLGGRFHGGFWQNIPSELRKRILINGCTTIEVDYGNLHIALLYGLKGMPFDGYDAYDLVLPPEMAMHVGRKLIKALMLVLINAKNKEEAFRALVSKKPDRPTRRTLDRQFVFSLIDAIAAKHSAIADSFCNDCGIEMMARDGRITSRIIDHFTKKGITVLSVHDSYIIDIKHQEELKTVMIESAIREIPGLQKMILEDAHKKKFLMTREAQDNYELRELDE